MKTMEYMRLRVMYFPLNCRMSRPDRAVNAVASTVDFLPCLSIAFERTILPIDKLIKLIEPMSPIRYGSSQIKSSLVIQLSSELLFVQSILKLSTAFLSQASYLEQWIADLSSLSMLPSASKQ